MTTPEQHNKYLAIAHIAHGALYALLMIAMLILFGVVLSAAGNSANAGNAPPRGILIIVWLMILLIYSLLIIPSFIAAYALLKRKSWAKVAAIVGGVVAAMSFPIGTAVCVYTFWFLFSEPGKLLYDTPAANRSLEEYPENQKRFMSDSPPPNWR